MDILGNEALLVALGMSNVAVETHYASTAVNLGQGFPTRGDFAAHGQLAMSAEVFGRRYLEGRVLLVSTEKMLPGTKCRPTTKSYSTQRSAMPRARNSDLR